VPGRFQPYERHGHHQTEHQDLIHNGPPEDRA
jgi:hypothetical protein